MKIKIFLYHRVSPIRDQLWDPIHPAVFEKQIKYISKKFNVIQLESYLLEDKRVLNDKDHNLAAIVFDDGYKDFKEYAFPILKKYDLPSSMYVVTNSVTNGEPIWTYAFDYIFSNTHKMLLDIKNKCSLVKEVIYWESVDDRLKYASKLKHKLKFIPDSDRIIVFNQIKEFFSDVELPRKMYLSWDDLRGLYLEGVYIGSHTVSHSLLGNMEKEDDIYYELNESRNIIKNQLGYYPQTISYPNGMYNEKVKKTAKKTGYRFGLAVNQTTYFSTSQDDFEISRIELFNENLFRTKLRIYEYIQKFKKMIKK